jgi:hypothetical protein
MPPHAWGPLPAPAVSVLGLEASTASTIGEFKVLASWTGVRHATSQANEIDGLYSEAESDDGSLSAILSIIGDEVQQFAASARASVMAEFAAAMQHARKTLPPAQIAGAVAVLKQARTTALTLIKRNAATQLKGRREAAIRDYRKRGRSHLRLQPPHGPRQN